MKIAFVINQTHKEDVNFTTTLLAHKALQLGHEIFYIGLADFYYGANSLLGAHARHVLPSLNITNTATLIQTVRSTEKKLCLLSDIDVLWLRFDPVLDMINRPWAAAAGLQFATLAQQQGLLVINNPEALTKASNKLYLDNFDESIQPKTIVTRSYDDVLHFFSEQHEKIILKPLKGSGGKNVFFINKENAQNLKQTVEAIGRDGYVIAQEYLPEAARGDIRFFLLNGKPIQVNGKYAAVHRVQQANEIRSNLHQGGKVQEAEINDGILHTVQKVAAQLVKDGMYLVGLDIVGDKIMEINVFSPGALYHAEQIHQEDFSGAIIRDLERMVKERGKIKN